MLNQKLNTPKGVGVGSLFSGLTREIIPVSKSTIEKLNKVMDSKSMNLMGRTLQQEASNAAVNNTLNLLKQKKIKKSKKKQLRRIAKNILTSTKNKKSLSVSQSKKAQKKNIASSAKKRKLKQTRGPKKKKSLMDDDY